MKKLSLVAAMALGLTFVAQLAVAEIIFNPNITYRSSKWESAGTTTSESSVLSADIKLGHLMSNGLYLGGFYNFESDSALNVEDLTSSSLAASIGYFNEGFLAMFSYHLMASRDETSTDTLEEGTGPQLDLAYVLPVTSSFSLGPQFRWRSVTYDKRETAAGTNDVDLTLTQIDPMVNLWFVF